MSLECSMLIMASNSITPPNSQTHPESNCRLPAHPLYKYLNNNIHSNGMAGRPVHHFDHQETNDLSQTHPKPTAPFHNESTETPFNGEPLLPATPMFPCRGLNPHGESGDCYSSCYSLTYSQRSDNSHCDSLSRNGNSRNKRKFATEPTSLLMMTETDSDYDPSEKVPSDKSFLSLRVFIFLASCCTILMCAYVLYCSDNCLPEVSPDKDELIRLSCDDLLSHPKWLKGVDLEHYRINSGTDCQVPMGLVIKQMATPGFDIVEAQVKLKATHKGKEMEFSNYYLSMQQSPVSTLAVDDDNLVIEEEGYYFVFFNLQLSYGHHEASPACDKLRYKTSISHLLRHRRDSPQKQYTVLLGAEHSCCESCETERSTAFTGGLFHLKKNDRLLLMVSAPENIGDEGDNYLGMFKMSAVNL